MLDQKRVGEYIAKLRKERGLTQSALAELLCVTHQAVSKWENGAALPDLEVLVAMRGVFGVSIDDILGCAEPIVSKTSVIPPCSTDSDASDNTITNDRIVIRGFHTFDSSVLVDQCDVVGHARFASDISADALNVMGKGTFDGSVMTDSLKVMGMATVAKEIHCDTLLVPGTLKVGSWITCDSLDVSGSVTCGSDLTCDSLSLRGTVTVGGVVTSDSVVILGMLTVGASVKTDSMKNSGVTYIGGAVDADELSSDGQISIEGGVMADSVNLSRRFNIGGGITAENVAVTLSRDGCAAAAIHAASLTVREMADHSGGVLKVGDIWSEYAQLVNVHAENVEMKSGWVGKGCVITRLRCTPDVEVLPGAEAKEIIRSL